MTLVKYGIASVFLVSATLLACGGSDSGGGGTAGKSNSSAGANSSSAGASNGGSTSASGAGNPSNGGGTPVGSGGNCGTGMMDPMMQDCPALLTCVQTKCKTQYDAATSVCAGQCTATNECQAASQVLVTCLQSSCINEAFSCIGAGTGGAGSGSAKTCADLATCCGTLPDAQDKMSCAEVARAGIDLLCGVAYSSICG